MPEWEITATTVHCAAVDDEVTILVAMDASATCTGRARRGKPAGRGKYRPGPCQDGACTLITETIARMKA